MKQLNIRYKPEYSDTKKIHDLTLETAVFSNEEISVAVELVEIALEKGSEQSGYHFIFLEDSELLAYACYGRTPFTLASFDLYWIVANPKVQGLGLAAKILSLVENAVREVRGERIIAETSSLASYTAAQKFYIKNGFKEILRIEDFYAPHNDKIIYLKKLV